VDNVSCFQLLEQKWKIQTDKPVPLFHYQQEIVDWLLVHIQHATGICSGMTDTYFSFIPSPLETDFKVRQDRPRWSCSPLCVPDNFCFM